MIQLGHHMDDKSKQQASNPGKVIPVYIFLQVLLFLPTGECARCASQMLIVTKRNQKPADRLHP